MTNQHLKLFFLFLKMISVKKHWFTIRAFFICLLVYSFSCTENKKPAEQPLPSTPGPIQEPAIDSLLITDSSWGLIRPNMKFTDLKAVYGEANLKDERICGPECVDSLDVTKLYPGTINEAIIYWKEKAWHKTIAMIVCYQDSARYNTDKGLNNKRGFSVLRWLNKQKIGFTGFGWDYGGSITSYHNGQLEKTAIHYELDISKNPSEDEMGVFGDTSLDSEMPLVKKLLPYIYIRKITLVLNNYEY